MRQCDLSAALQTICAVVLVVSVGVERIAVRVGLVLCTLFLWLTFLPSFSGLPRRYEEESWPRPQQLMNDGVRCERVRFLWVILDGQFIQSVIDDVPG